MGEWEMRAVADNGLAPTSSYHHSNSCYINYQFSNSLALQPIQDHLKCKNKISIAPSTRLWIGAIKKFEKNYHFREERENQVKEEKYRQQPALVMTRYFLPKKQKIIDSNFFYCSLDFTTFPNVPFSRTISKLKQHPAHRSKYTQCCRWSSQFLDDDFRLS